MKILVVKHDVVKELLTPSACRTLMAEALAALARERAINPLRQGMWLPERKGVLGMMPGALLDEPGVLGMKTISVFPGNHSTEFDCHQGAVMLFETENGCPQAIVDASALTEIRTAAVSAVATMTLARDAATTLAILGSGVQARAHLVALTDCRPFDEVVLWSRNQENAQRLAATARVEIQVNANVRVEETAEAAVAGADVICTTTAASDPVLLGRWLSAGQHINAVGASVAFARELDSEAVARGKFYVDRRESARNESGAYLRAIEEGAIDESHIQGELGEVLIGAAKGREDDQAITIFKSLGLAVEDLAAAVYVVKLARERDLGVEVEL